MVVTSLMDSEVYRNVVCPGDKQSNPHHCKVEVSCIYSPDSSRLSSVSIVPVMPMRERSPG